MTGRNRSVVFSMAAALAIVGHHTATHVAARVAQETESGFVLLFDGTSTKGWRGYRSHDVPDAWTIKDGALTLSGKGGDIMTNDEFDDFELAFEWRISEGGNSGVFYRATEGADEIYWTAPEYQILDNAKHADGKEPKTSAGSCYALYAPAKDATRPVGQWNEARIVARGPHVEHWMNGTRLLAYEIGSPDWNTRIAGSKFKPYPQFGRAPKGHIGLQDHGNVVSYRKIRIRQLK